MKKIFLLTILFFQMTFVFGQKILGESNEMINYDTEWGNWTSIPGVSNVLFSSKLKWYDKVKNSYGWEIRWKATRTPIYFEYKIPNIIFKSYENVVQENGGWFSTVLSNQNQATGGYGIDCNSKTTVLIQVRNVCFEFEGGNPKCNKTNASSNQSNNTNNNQNTQPTTTTNSSQNQINKSPQQNQVNQDINTQQNTEVQPQQSLTEFNNTIKDFMQSIPNVQESKETLDKMKSFELAKLDIEPEFNIISSPNDYNKVSLTTINYQNLDKKGNVAVSIITSALSNVDKAKDKAFSSAKIQTAFLGANTLLVKVIEIGGKTLGGPYTYPTTDVFGIAYSDKKINFDMFKQFIEINKNLKIVKCLSHKVNSNDIKSEKCGKTIMISDVSKKDEKVKITANIDGITETYSVINFGSNGFTLMNKVEEDSKRAKLYNYMIEIQ